MENFIPVFLFGSFWFVVIWGMVGIRRLFKGSVVSSADMGSEVDALKARSLNGQVNEVYQEIKARVRLERALAKKVAEIAREQYLVEPCAKCHEHKMKLDAVSPSAKSITYTCDFCGKNNRAPAISGEAVRIGKYKNKLAEMLKEDSSYLEVLQELTVSLFEAGEVGLVKEKISSFSKIGFDCTETFCFFRTYDVLGCNGAGEVLFETREAIMPYEQTERKSISPAVRSEVWRRDLGKCVQCGSKENLQFDHIIPVSKGGATSIANLQLLCRACNQRKGNRI